MKKLILILFIAICSYSSVNAQSINIHSITTMRQPLGDGGYTLDGLQMVDSRAKLLNTNNFGATGTYTKSVVITDSYDLSGSLANITGTPNIDMFYFGIFNNGEPSLVPFANEELDSLHAWSMRGGKLIIGTGSPVPSFPFLPDILNSRWGFDLALFAPTPIFPTAAGIASTLFTGPFGTISLANQGGGSQGYFTTIPTDIVLLADDGAGHPTIYLDCATLDLVVADGDAYTTLGGISTGSGITVDNDILWANTIAYMDALESQPVITQNGTQLSTGTYSSYQWYLNGNMIAGATSNTYTASQSGTYSVKVPLACGCNNVASQGFTFVGMQEYEELFPINISPNPANDNGVNFSGVLKPLTVSVFGIDGKLVDAFSLTQQKQFYNTAQLENGIYFLKMYDLKGNFVSTKKLIKQ